MRGIKPEEVERGQVVAVPDTIRAYRSFEAEITLLATEEGGHGSALATGTRSYFYFRTTDVAGTLETVETKPPRVRSRCSWSFAGGGGVDGTIRSVFAAARGRGSMIGPKDVRRWIDSAVGQAVLTAGMGLVALWPGTGARRLVFGLLFAVGSLNLLLMVLGPFLVRRAAAKGHLRGRHSRA